jgi:hypothetical protein
MSLRESFSVALRLVTKYPQLFVPKLVVAIAYGVLLLMTADVIYKIADASSLFLIPDASVAASLFSTTLVLFFLTLGAFVLDVWVSAWYPALVAQYRANETLSFRKAMALAGNRFWTVLPLFLGMELVISVIFGLVTSLGFVFLPYPYSVLVIVLVLAGLFVFSVVVYPLLPVGVLENKSASGSISRSLTLSRLNWKSFSIAALLPFAISLANLAVAFFSDQLQFWLLFWAVRLLLVLVVTYNAVVNPAVYFSVVEQRA